MCVMSFQEQSCEKVQKPRHEGVLEPMEMGAITHLLGENIRRINFTGDMLDCDGLVLDPFPNRFFAKLNVTCRLGCHVVRPLDTSVVIIKEEGGFINIRDGKTRLRKSKTEIA